MAEVDFLGLNQPLLASRQESLLTVLDGPPEGLIALLMATALGPPGEPATINTDAAGGPL